MDSTSELTQIANGELQKQEELLVIDPKRWKDYEFKPIDLSGVLAEVLKGSLNPEKIIEDQHEIDDNLFRIFDQLRKQELECKTSIALTDEKKFLLQVNPSVGSEDSVNNTFAEPPNGKKIFEVHNHPPRRNPDGTTETFGFFSAHDLGGFAFRRTHCIAEAVVFQEGTAILIRTQRTNQIIDEKIKDVPQRRWAWVSLANDLIKKIH